MKMIHSKWDRSRIPSFPRFVVLAFLFCVGFGDCLRAVPLGEALDATNLVWTTGGDGEWIGQTEGNFDGVDAARTPVLKNHQTAWLQTTVTGPGTFSFWAKRGGSGVSFEFFYDNASADRIGEYYPLRWLKTSVEVEAGTHILKWVFQEGFCDPYIHWNDCRNRQAGEVDQVIWIPANSTNSQPPVIQVQPFDWSNAVGTEARFHVLADGAQPLNYKWKFNGSDIPFFGTAMTLTLSDIQMTNAGNYSVEISNAYGSVTSQSVTLTVGVAPSAMLTPVFPVIAVGETVALHGTASGTAPLSFQWRFNGQAIADATGTSLVITNAQSNDSGTYSLTVSNFVGITTTNSYLAVTSPSLAEALDATNLVWRSFTSQDYPTWFGQTNLSVDGDAAQTGGGAFSPAGWIETDVTGPGSLSFMWRVQAFAYDINSAPIWGRLNFLLDGTDQSTQLSGFDLSAGWKRVIISVPSGSHTLRWSYDGAALQGFAARVDQVQYPDGIPDIVVQPTNWNVIAGNVAGNRVQFDAGAVGHDLNYQWRFNDVDIAGATNASHIISTVQLSDAGLYSVAVSNTFGVTNSTSGILSVRGVPPIIVVQPKEHSVEVGSSLGYGTLSAAVEGSGPMTHRWMFNETTPLAETNGASRYLYPEIPDVQYSHAGTYQLFITNAFGATNTVPAMLVVVPTLADALDTTNWTWTRPSSSGWRSQTLVTHDGADAAHSSGVLGSVMETTVTGPKVMSFRFKTGESYSILRVMINHALKWSFTGVTDWQEATLQIPVGDWKITVSADFLVWLDEINFTPAVSPSILSQTENQSVFQGELFGFSVNASGSAPLVYQWYFKNMPIAGATGSTYTRSDAQPVHVGDYHVVVANTFGSQASSNALLTVKLVVTTSTKGHGTISPTPDVFVNAGGQQTFTATPSPHNTVGEWYTNGIWAQPGGSNFTLLNIATNYAVQVVFHPIIKLYWQHTNGLIAEWHFNGTNFLGSALLPAINPAWRMVGQSDFNSDEQIDLLFQNTDGRLVLRTMDGPAISQAALVSNGKAVPTGWKLKGLSDLNSDGETDFLFQTSSNSLASWFMNDGTNLLSRALMQSHNPGWKVVGAADFNGDDQKDILWQDPTGVVAVWFMDETTKTGGVALRKGKTAAAGWDISALADMDYNGQEDILLRNTDGQVSVWFMDGTNYLGSVLLRNGQTSGSSWRLTGPK